MKTTDSKRIRSGYEPIPGYVLEEVIGRGGFGEVWRSSAPGGLKKAVKFVFGAHDQSHAERELKSLERIKGVHHPFLLTLERFEAIENQLVIVTELADCSLEDVYKEHRDNGSCGIPRKALVSHLHDAADALDYLHEQYQLQHLDIKPGNLLLVGGHVKVADFGLLKDLRDIEVSVVGGLTPIYAPPEVFDGRPNMHSDQYSLAVMYQELLTGTRPFSGRTIAQLATQHVHSAPNLEPLPPSDRPVIARALEKNPLQRFPSCKDFVEALRSPRGKTSVTVGGSEISSNDTDPSMIAAGESVKDLPQLVSDGEQPNTTGSNTKLQHAFVVALGGTGAECLRELRRRVADRHSTTSLHLSSALIDTDMASIHSMRVAQISDRVPTCNSIYTPLRTAQEYRQNGTERLRTISRRWIYNVPRSGATEGMRPLGRLALVDHGEMVTKRLTEAVTELIEAANGATPQVYVVGSLAGGTCSGMYIDVVHLLRHLMDEAGLEQVKILSMLASAPLQIDPAHPLALHDTQAAMIEMRHFLKAGNGYPGDPGAGWPSVPAARTPLKHVYVVSGATHGSITPTPSHTITDYIWADATGAKDLLCAARALKLEEETAISVPSVRSVGVVPLGDTRRLAQKVLAPAAVRELLLQWLGLPSKAKKAAVTLSDRIMRRVGITEKAVVEAIQERVKSEGIHEQILEAVASLDSTHQNDPAIVAQALTPIAERMVASGEFQSHLEDLLANLRRELIVGLNDRKADITTVIESLKRIGKFAWDLAEELRQGSTPVSITSENENDVPAESFAIEAVAARVVTSYQLECLCDNLHLIQERFDRFATTLAMSIVQAQNTQGNDTNPWDDLPKEIRSQFQFVVVQLHESAVRRFLTRPFGDQVTIVDPRSMVSDMIDAAVPFVAEVFDENADVLGIPDDLSTTLETSTSSLLNNSSSTDSLSLTLTAQIQTGRVTNPANESLTVDEAVVAVKPTMLMFGGRQRLLLTVGSEQERTQLEPQVRAAHEGSLTVAVLPGTAPRLIHEAQQISLTDVLSRLSVLNGANSQVTGRLSSRTDVNWQ